uniref:NADH dehydrogenase subunit 6 n=1 Tax=Dicerca corrugata TaxID=1857262 RepID=UPI002008EBCE|nr:NADH dehydrogenase subunit 6 [Dicerca corrugata]UPI13494.1 NADH dehydrogenase subunit 6 [Dicerca corrugata]
MLLMFMMSLTLSMVFLATKHPLSMGLLLLLQSTLIASVTGFFNYNFWYSYILFLIMVGGMLVLFIYMTSIASNEKFENSNTLVIMVMLMTILTLTVYIWMDKLYIHQNFNSLDIQSTYKIWNLSLSKFINFPSNVVLYMIITYLFVTLIAIVKITDLSYGALRQKF